MCETQFFLEKSYGPVWMGGLSCELKNHDLCFLAKKEVTRKSCFLNRAVWLAPNAAIPTYLTKCMCLVACPLILFNFLEMIIAVFNMVWFDALCYMVRNGMILGSSWLQAILNYKNAFLNFNRWSTLILCLMKHFGSLSCSA